MNIESALEIVIDDVKEKIESESDEDRLNDLKDLLAYLSFYDELWFLKN